MSDWLAREYQQEIKEFLESGGKRAVLVWHRRAGKDSVALHFTAEAMYKRIGLYWHMLPTAAQGRKVIWDALLPDGRRLIDQAFPPGCRKAVHRSEMKLEMANGSIWQVVGSDNFNSLVGTNPVGVVFSEFALADPAAWDFIRPILAENGGYAVFVYTPRGRNHGYRLFDMAQNNTNWFSQVLGVDETGAIPASAVDEERAGGMAEEIVQQEFYCSFDASLVGSYYGPELTRARKDGRIGSVPYDPVLPVHTVWDIGIGDATAIGFVQAAGPERHFIDYYENSGVGIQHYIRLLQERAAERDWVYGRHFAPHDIAHAEWGTGRSRLETARDLGLRFEVVPRWPIDEGIQAVRNILPLCRFDEVRCSRLIDALVSYRKEWDDRLKLYRERPLHDWASHAADMMRYFAVGFRDPRQFRQIAAKAETDWNPFGGN